VPLLYLSNWVLQSEPFVRNAALLTVTVMTFGLSSLSVGIGALLPNFREDNPARIANGLGGTANAMLSLSYIGLSVALILVPMNFWSSGNWDTVGWWVAWRTPYLALFGLFQLSVVVVPMLLGLRHWSRLEF
jgi:ABC-2 type transport system permease protein